MSKIIHVHDIRLESETDHHDDVPPDMKIFAQLIVDGTILWQTAPVLEESRNSWKLEFDCEVPIHTISFLIAIMRISETRGNRILGSIAIVKEDVLVSLEQKTDLSWPLTKVNPDGPCMRLSACFSVTTDVSTPGFAEVTGTGDIQIKLDALDDEAILIRLQDLDNANASNPEDVLELALMHERILIFSNHGEQRASCLDTLGDIYLRLYKTTQAMHYLIQAVCAYTDAVRDAPGDSECHGDLGVALRHRFEQLGNVEDLKESVRMARQAVELTLDDDPDKHGWMNNLGTSLRLRFEHLADLRDIDESVMMLQQSAELIPDSHYNKPVVFNNLSVSLYLRFERTGNVDDIDRSVSVCQRAIELTMDDHPAKIGRWNNLGNSLYIRFERFGDLGDIDHSILILQKAVKSTPDGHPDKPLLLTNLGNSTRARFSRVGDLANINESVLASQRAVELTPEHHPSQAAWLCNLGYSLMLRFDRLGDLGDLNESVAHFRKSVELTPDEHSKKSVVLNNLGISLVRRFERLQDLDDMNNSVVIFRRAVALTPDVHPAKPGWLNSLGLSLVRCWERLGDLANINESVLIFQQAMELTPFGHPNTSLYCNSLAYSLLCRYTCLGDLDDIEKSVAMAQQAVKLTPDGHPGKAGWLNNFGNSLRARFERLQHPSDFQQMIAQYESAACSPTSPAYVRFKGASTWAQEAQKTQHPSLLHAYSVALDLLPELVWLALSINDRHHQIREAGTLVRAAAAAAVAAAQYDKAVEWLEQGRSIIWGQLLALRTPVDLLRETHPALADELISLSMVLERAAIDDRFSASNSETLHSTAHNYHESAHSRDRLLKKIRGLEGFERFLLPKTVSELFRATECGPVVILNISESRCDALALMQAPAGKVLHVSLPDFTMEDARNLAESLGVLVHTNGRGERLGMQREGYVAREVQLANVLSDLWLRVVKPVLDGLGITTSSRDNPQRIWWCPTGPLAFLPIHAAGLYGDSEAFGSKLSDFAVSSYTPSLTSLIQGFRAGSGLQNTLQLLAVAQPSADGQAYIPGTEIELDNIETLAISKLSVVRLEQNAATVARVLQVMKDSRWVHFACHGVQNIYNPTQSALLLAGSSQLTLSSIIELSMPNVDFAFLSACQTATGTTLLEEEAVHLAAGMLLAGYRGVIATMWSIMDNDAPQLAADVYAHLFKTSPPDPTRAAEALHLAVRRLREESLGKKSLFNWVPFIHVGV
ncbi:CHAT domain-containing protein [Mycena epipterygia]|nr:CHAT domain-containing protein [Mycena epipterygia]